MLDYRYDPSWRHRRRKQMAALITWAIAAVLITGVLETAVWMGGMGYLP